MKLWSFQSVDVAHLLQSGHSYICNPRLSEIINDKEDPEYSKMFIRGYDFISKHLNKVDPQPNGVIYPVWSWYSTNKESEEIIINNLGEDYKDNKEEFVLLELEVPDNKVLLSNFATFHDVLNDHTSENNDYFKQVCDSYRCDSYEYENGEIWCEDHWKEAFELMDNATEEEKQISWDKYVIKNIDYDNEFIQACFWKLSPGYVLNYHSL